MVKNLGPQLADQITVAGANVNAPRKAAAHPILTAMGTNMFEDVGFQLSARGWSGWLAEFALAFA
jgi:hypothetical protein